MQGTRVAVREAIGLSPWLIVAEFEAVKKKFHALDRSGDGKLDFEELPAAKMWLYMYTQNIENICVTYKQTQYMCTERERERVRGIEIER